MARKKVVKKRAVSKSPKEFEPKAIVAMTLAISGFVLLLLSTPILSLIFFLAGLIFSLVSKKNMKTKMAKKALILNIIGLALTIIWWIILVQWIAPYILSLTA